MKCSTKPLPPLNSLKAFLVVMRQGSFRAAADVLLVSPQAVSQQIKLLEDILKITLFERRSRTIVPTKQADELYMFVNAGFEEISEGVRRVSNTDLRERISLNVSPYFASNYLINNLDKLRSVMPDADLRITSMIDLPDFATDNVDVSIQWGFGKWKGLDTSLLVRDPKVICCTPELAKRIQTPNDLKQVTLLYPLLAHSFWLDILNFLGIDVPNFQGDIEFQDASSMRRATLSGLGVGLISRDDAIKDIERGRLVAPLGVDLLNKMPLDQIPGFYLVLPKSHMRVKIIAEFCQWMTHQNWLSLYDQT